MTRDASRRASAFPVAVLLLLLAARVFDVVYLGHGGQVLFTVALFVVPLLYAAPGSGPLLLRCRWLVLVVQGVLTWVPFAVFGAGWQVGIGGLLAGLVLLVVPGRGSWLLAGVLRASELVVRAAVTGLPVVPAWFAIVYVIHFSDCSDC